MEMLLDAVHASTAAAVWYHGGPTRSTPEDRNRRERDRSSAPPAVVLSDDGQPPTREIATIVEQLAIKALGMLLMYDELKKELRHRVEIDLRFPTLEQLLGHRFGDESWDVQSLMVLARKKARASRSTTPGDTEDDEMEENLLEEDLLIEDLDVRSS